MADWQQIVLTPDLLVTLLEEALPSPDIGTTEAPTLLWNAAGLLAEPMIQMTPAQLLKSQLVTGLDLGIGGWCVERRLEIGRELDRRLIALSILGCPEITVSGEFVEQIAEPIGVDGYFRIPGQKFNIAQLRDYLQTLTPELSWDFDNYSSQQLVQLQPVFCYTDALGEMEILPAPMSRYHSHAEGLPKGVVKLAFH